jgi:hypothetical protein
MDNAAFRSFVTGGGSGGGASGKVSGCSTKKGGDGGADGGGRQLTTKEIARQAVQEEFDDRKRKRGGGHFNADYYSDEEEDNHNDAPRRSSSRQRDGGGAEGDDLSSDEEQQVLDTTTAKEQDNDNETDEPAWKKERREKRSKKKEKGSQYRDRAKERRSGALNPDYKASRKLDDVAKEVDKEMSKYLGGDEQHTHLVKGLDFALARHEKERKLQPKQSGFSFPTNSTTTTTPRNAPPPSGPGHQVVIKEQEDFGNIDLDDLDRIREEAAEQQNKLRQQVIRERSKFVGSASATSDSDDDSQTSADTIEVSLLHTFLVVILSGDAQPCAYVPFEHPCTYHCVVLIDYFFLFLSPFRTIEKTTKEGAKEDAQERKEVAQERNEETTQKGKKEAQA